MKKNKIKLSEEERKELKQMGSSGNCATRAIRRSQTLLKSKE